VSDLPENWVETPLEKVVEILDSRRSPINAQEREKRIAGKKQEELYPYYGATGQVGYIDDYIFDEPLILLGEDGVPFLDPMRPKAYLADGKYWVNNHAHALKAIEGVSDRRYLCAFLNSYDYREKVTGTTRL
jgi:type I restriction enzyme S subunit